MRSFILSVIAEILIMKEQNARMKHVKRQIKLADFYNKHEKESYYSKDFVLRQLQILRNLPNKWYNPRQNLL